MFEDKPIVIRGAGDLATGVAVRLWRSGFPVIMTEMARPLTVRRAVSLSDAVYDGDAMVEEIRARLAADKPQIMDTLRQGAIPVYVDPEGAIIGELRPYAVIDAIMAKRNTGSVMDVAPLVVGLGPGFTAGKGVHAVVETKRGHTLGRVIWEGSALPDTGIPGEIKGVGAKRVLRAPGSGIFKGVCSIGTHVEKGDIVAYAGDIPVLAPISGMLRGLLHDGVPVQAGLKSGDIDPRDIQENCRTISDKALAVGGGALEAVLTAINGRV